jgi:hypothetical protein
VSETESVGTRRRCRKAFLAAGPVAVLLILSGRGLAHAAEAESTDPAVVDVTDTSTASNSAGVSVPGASGLSSTSAEQTISVSIEPGPLTVSPSSQSVTFSGANVGTDEGELGAVTVADARGSLIGWTATVTLQSVSGLDTSQSAHARLCVTPHTVAVVTGNPPEVQSAKGSCGSLGDPLVVFFAPPNGGGGTFSDTAGLTLGLPGGAGSDQVTASVAVAVR